MSGVYNCLAKYLFGVRLCRGLVLLEPELSSIPNWEISKAFPSVCWKQRPQREDRHPGWHGIELGWRGIAPSAWCGCGAAVVSTELFWGRAGPPGSLLRRSSLWGREQLTWPRSTSLLSPSCLMARVATLAGLSAAQSLAETRGRCAGRLRAHLAGG